MPSVLIAVATVICSIYRKGLLSGLIWVISYCYLKFTHWFSCHRLDLYDFESDDPEKTGFLIPHEEWTLESPQSAVHLEKNTDVVFFNATNSSSEGLVIGLYRQGDGKVQISLVLRLANGCIYSIPPEHSLQAEIDEPHTFGCSRVKIECLQPMRRWRVFFNGMLRKTSNDQEDISEGYCHVKFSFIWTASSGVHDNMYDASPKVLADVAANFWTWKSPPLQLLQRMRNSANGYEQCGMLMGTVNFEGQPEREVYLWGLRGRYMGAKGEQQQYQSFDAFINSENGNFIRLGILNTGHIQDMPYGYVMRPNGFIFPMESVTFSKKKDGPYSETHFVCAIDDEKFRVELSTENLRSKFHGRFNAVTSINQYEGYVNSVPARGFIMETKTEVDMKPTEQSARQPDKIHKSSLMQEPVIPLSLPFHELLCCELSVSGGKGASLAKLTGISEELKMFTVPKGIVVTTSAYNTFTRDFLRPSIKKLEEAVWKQDQDKTAVHSACARVMDEIINADLPSYVEESIKQTLDDAFGKDITNVRFAVRSSATGEDTEQMSAAGQMETFLGCKGFSEVLSAVKKCWASQFSFVAIEYKRHYGQLLDTPMGVVIQEMVSCDAAGVAFTCDPVTGNPSYISITANYGLGESVVSASAEPDTVTLKRDIKDRLCIHAKTAGVKQTKIIMDESGGTKEVKLEQELSDGYSISEDIALKLGDIAVKIEKQFGTPRDIEWGVLGKEIFLFQARPVTTIDTETDFETGHTFDTYLRREDEFFTTANVGEVLPGAASPLGMECIKQTNEITFVRQKYTNLGGDNLPSVPYYTKRFAQILNHFFVCLSDGFMKFSESDGEDISDFTKAVSVAVLGRILDNKKLFQVARDRHASSEKKFRIPIVGSVNLLLYMFFGRYFRKSVSKRPEMHLIPIEKKGSAMEIFWSIVNNFQATTSPVFDVHVKCSFASTFWNMGLLSLLEKARGEWGNDVYRDFGHLLSSVKDVESADVPSSIQKLGITISQCIEPEKFKQMTVDEALKWLQTTTTEAGIGFRRLLERHGHRCLREIDIGAKTWAMDPRNLVRTLQDVTTKSTEDSTQKRSNSFQDIISNMLIPLNFSQRLYLRFLLPNCHRGVREREASKSLMVKAYNTVRVAFWQLADAMVREGRLPSRDLLFFLCVEEIHQLIKTRSPKLVIRAFRRWKIQPELDGLIFPEIISGIPKPINLTEEVDISGDGFSMTGIPVSHGVIKGIARVVMNIDEAPKIQHGEILITHSTDVAWSPYFPMISGIATELGGLISHGAVVAREYGLPCIVGLQGATRAFKSGDFVLLDGNHGVLQKIENL